MSLPNKFIELFKTYTAPVVVAFAVAATLPSLSIWLGLPPEGDAIDYRIPLVKWMAAHQSFPNWPWTFVEDYPALGEILMSFLYTISPNLMRLVPIGAYVGLAWAAARLVKHFDSAIPGMLAAAWILALRPLTIGSNLLLVDNLSSFFLLASLVFLLSRRPMTAGAFAAAALATRYTTWPTAPALLVVCWYLSDGKARDRIKELAKFAAVAALGPLPFVIRNVILNENPFFPLAGALFGQDIPLPYFGYGRGKDPISFLLLPYDFLYTNTFVKGFYDYTLGKLFYVQLVAVLAAAAYTAVKPRARERVSLLTKEVKAIWIFFAIHLVAWFLGAQQMRFFVPGLVILNLGMLAYIWRRLGSIPVVMLAALSAFSVASIQKDSILIAIGKRPAPWEAEHVIQAKNCLAQLPTGSTLGIIDRDGTLGFLDVNFYFYPPNGHAVPGTIPPPDFIYYVYYDRPFPGYKPWPQENPCMLKKSG